MLRLLSLFVAGLALFSSTAQADGALIGGNAEAGKAIAATCAACHGADGNSASPAFPSLAGQSPVYLYKELQAFKSGARSNPIMLPQASRMSEQDMKDVAAFFAGQKASFGAANPDVVAAGRKLYQGGDLEAGIPACAACHGPTGAGVASAGFPHLSGQHAPYVAAQLKAFKSGARKGSTMNVIAAKLSAKDIQILSSFVEGLH